MLKRQFRKRLILLAVFCGAAMPCLQGSSDAQELPERVFKCNPISKDCPPKNISENYSGTITDTVSGQGAMTLSIIEKHKHLSGAWAASFTNGDSNSETVAGTASKTGITMKLRTQVPHCALDVVVTRVSFEIQGTFASEGRCPQEDSGRFTVAP